MIPPKVSILIVNYKVPALLEKCLSSIRHRTSCTYEVIVLDNNSDDGSVEMIQQKFPWVRLMVSTTNSGFARGNNVALELAKGDYVFYLNPDTELTSDSITYLAGFLDNHENVGMVAPKLLNSDGSLQRSVRNFYSFKETLLDNRLFPFLKHNRWFQTSGLPSFWDHNQSRDIDWARGAALMVRRSILDKLGAFDERFWVYGEEIDLCYRIKNAGWAIRFLPDVEIVHHQNQSARQNSTAMFIQNYRSHYLLLKKHYSILDRWLYQVRAMCAITVWIAWFGLKTVQNSDDDAPARELVKYKKLLAWHFRRDEVVAA